MQVHVYIRGQFSEIHVERLVVMKTGFGQVTQVSHQGGVCAAADGVQHVERVILRHFDAVVHRREVQERPCLRTCMCAYVRACVYMDIYVRVCVFLYVCCI